MNAIGPMKFQMVELSKLPFCDYFGQQWVEIRNKQIRTGHDAAA